MPSTMRAVVLDAPGGPEALQLRTLPRPVPVLGQVLVQVRAFGLNRSELFTRRGMSPGVALPRVLGIEATGVVAECPGGEFAPGTQVAALMGGMGRVFDGGYAEYTCVPVGQVVPFTSSLPWATLGAVPEMLQTAHGSLTARLGLRAGQHLLVRGGTSSVGLAAAVLARRLGATVLSTTRDAARAPLLTAVGVQHVVVDTGAVADAVHALVPGGVDATLELVGAPTLRDSIAATRPGGTVCFTGMLSNSWVVPDFYPIDHLAAGQHLTAYSGDAADLPPAVLQGFLDDAAAGRVTVPVGRVFDLEHVVEAHALLEAGGAGGKIVVVT